MSQGDAAQTAAPAETESGSAAAGQLHRWVRGGKSFSGRERNVCFLNTGETRFADVSAVAGLDYPDDARALCLVDWDRDGDVDLWVANRNGPQVRLLRNDAPAGKKFVALRLRGTKSNRDAIGARVEVYPAGDRRPPSIKTVRAGDGFLSQSSKWLHFGLADAGGIDRVTVRWPSGTVEEFHELELNRRHVLVEGNGRSDALPDVAIAPLSDAPQALPAGTEVTRIWLFARPPLPRMEYRKSSAAATQVPLGQGAALVNLWSASCAACQAELKEWRAHGEELERAGVAVVVLSVDALENSAGTSLPPANLPKSFAFGTAAADLIDRLQIVNDLLLDRHRPLPAPTSLLIDREGRLAAIYKGRVGWAALAADIKRLDGDDDTRRADSAPFAGRWHGPAPAFRPVTLASALAEGGFPDDAMELAARLNLKAEGSPKYAKLAARLGTELFRRGDAKGAIDRYREALAVDPSLAVAHLNLAVALVHTRQLPAAERAFREAIRSEPDYAAARVQLAALLAQTNRASEAVEHLESVLLVQANHPAANLGMARIELQRGKVAEATRRLEIATQTDSRNAESWGLLGMAYSSARATEKAIAAFERALALRPGWPLAADQLAWILATEPRFRNPANAVTLAEAAVGPEAKANPRALDTLAAAYAAAGRFDDAVRTAEDAIKLAQKTGSKSLEAGLLSRLQRYKAGKDLSAPP